MIIIQLHKISSTLKISFNLVKYMVQLLEICHATQEGCIFLGNVYNDLRNVVGVVPGCALLVGKVAEQCFESYMTFCEVELISFWHVIVV